MTILLHDINNPGLAATCDLKTVVHSDVYIRRSTGDLKAVSQEQYKDMEKSEAATPAQ
jgi:hypothetical protein